MGMKSVGMRTGEEAVRPRDHRLQTEVPATARRFQKPNLSIVVRNVSVTGFGADYEGFIPVGAQLLLHVEELGDFPAVVRWSLAGSFGAKFNGRLCDSQKARIAELVRSGRSLATRATLLNVTSGTLPE